MIQMNSGIYMDYKIFIIIFQVCVSHLRIRYIVFVGTAQKKVYKLIGWLNGPTKYVV